MNPKKKSPKAKKSSSKSETKVKDIAALFGQQISVKAFVSEKYSNGYGIIYTFTPRNAEHIAHYLQKHNKMILNVCGINYIVALRSVILVLNTYIKSIINILIMSMVNILYDKNILVGLNETGLFCKNKCIKIMKDINGYTYDINMTQHIKEYLLMVLVLNIYIKMIVNTLTFSMINVLLILNNSKRNKGNHIIMNGKQLHLKDIGAEVKAVASDLDVQFAAISSGDTLVTLVTDLYDPCASLLANIYTIDELLEVLLYVFCETNLRKQLSELSNLFEELLYICKNTDKSGRIDIVCNMRNEYKLSIKSNGVRVICIHLFHGLIEICNQRLKRYLFGVINNNNVMSINGKASKFNVLSHASLSSNKLLVEDTMKFMLSGKVLNTDANTNCNYLDLIENNYLFADLKLASDDKQLSLRNIEIKNILIDFYGNCGGIHNENDNKLKAIVSSGSLMNEYINNNLTEKALKLYGNVKSIYNLEPNNICHQSAIEACFNINNLRKEEEILQELLERSTVTMPTSETGLVTIETMETIECE